MISTAFARKGFHLIRRDVDISERHNMAAPNAVDGVLEEFDHCADDGNPTVYVHQGVHCQIYTMASFGYYRDADNLDGYPLGHKMWIEAKEKLCTEANEYADNSAELFNILAESGIPTTIENPRRSYLWQRKSYVELLANEAYDAITVYSCQFGMPYQKPYTILCANIPSLRKFGSRVCTCGPHAATLSHWDTATDRPQVDTKDSNSYPKKLVNAWCGLVVKHHDNLRLL